MDSSDGSSCDELGPLSKDQPSKQDSDSRGIPLKSDYPDLPVAVLYIGMHILVTLICVGLAWAIFTQGSTAKYERKLRIVADLELGWIYVAVYTLKLGALCLNINLGTARKASRVNVPDQQVYKVHVPEGAAPLGYVLLENSGKLGRFNRAQRGLANFQEVIPLVLVYVGLAGFVFPFPTFVLATFWGVFRIVYAIGYTDSPSGRMTGNVISMLLLGVMEGLVVVAGFIAISQ